MQQVKLYSTSVDGVARPLFQANAAEFIRRQIDRGSKPELSPLSTLGYTVAPARSGGAGQMSKQASQVTNET